MLQTYSGRIVAMNVDSWVSRAGTKKRGLGGWLNRLEVPVSTIDNLGKPSSIGATILVERGLEIEASIVVGDNATTDGALARSIGADFLLFQAARNEE